MNERTPLVSVIIGTYRREESLRRAVQSALKQTYKNLEILIADDNADPEWNRKVREIAEESGVIHIQNETNLGSARNRTRAAELAKGEYIAFLDDDDIYMPEKIENQLEVILREDADVCIEDLRLVDENGRFIENRKRGFIRDFERKDLMRCHLLYHLTGTDTLMFRRGYFLEIGGFPPINLGDELYLMANAIEGGGKFAYHEGIGVEAVVHNEGGLSSGENKLKCEKGVHAFKKKYRHLFSFKEWRFICMRHHAVNAFVHLRVKSYGRFFVSAACSFVCAPVACLSFLKEKYQERSEG